MIPRNLLRLDWTAGAAVGSFFLLLHRPLSTLLGLPVPLLLAMSAANLLYAAYSFSLARRTARPLPLLHLLIAANAAWSVFCLYLCLSYRPTASLLGLLHLALESFFVGALAALEWRFRHLLANPQQPAA